MRGCGLLLAYILKLFGGLCVVVGAMAWLPFNSDDMRLDLIGVLVFVVGGSLFFVAGEMARRWIDKQVLPAKPKVFVLRPGDTRFIGGMLYRDRGRYLWLGVFLLAFDALMLWAAMQPAYPPRPPEAAKYGWIEYVFGGGTLIFLAAMGCWLLFHSFRLRNPATTRLYRVLMKTPNKVTGLTIHFFQAENAPETIGRQIFAEIHVGQESVRAGATVEQCSLLRQYIQLHSPQADYREVDHDVP